MKKKLILCTAIALCMILTLMALAACGKPTDTYKEFWNYIDDQGGELEYKKLNDSNFKSLDIRYTTSSKSILVHMSWSESGVTHFLDYTFYKDSSKPVHIYYFESYTSQNMSISCYADCSNLSNLYTLEIDSVNGRINGESIKQNTTSNVYTSTVSVLKGYIPKTTSWITSTLRVVLNNNNVSVNDLYVLQ